MKKLLAVLLFTLAAVCANALPSVVAHKSFLKQTANIPTTTIFTPTVAGEYRVSIYLESNSSAPGVNAKVCGTDDTNTAWCADTNLSNGTASQVTFVAHSPARKPILLGAADFSGATYNVFVVIERLN